MRAPIRVRLTVAYCVVFCCSTLLLEVGTYWGIRSAIYSIVDHDLRSRLLGVEDFLNEHVARKPLAILQDEIRRHEALQPRYLSIAEAGGPTLFLGAGMLSSNAESLRVLAVRRRIQGRDFNLRLATGLAVPLEIMGRARFFLWISAPIVLLCASLAGYWISGRALSPVAELTRAARSVEPGSLACRVAVPRSGDEIQELALTLNDMLARMDSAFRQITQFTANASHELRTPLALIRTTSEVALLRTSANAATYREALHRIMSEAERNTALLDNLLLLARADSGEQVLERRPVDVSTSIRRACEQVEVLATEKGLDLQPDLTGQSLWVFANPEHLRRLWLILLDNAIKYTPAGGEIRIGLQAVNPGSVRVTIADTGIGIAEQDLPRIFDRFFRADEARNKAVGGTGLGLSIARWIVDAHEATVDVHSTVGRGTSFAVLFPLMAASAGGAGVRDDASLIPS